MNVCIHVKMKSEYIYDMLLHNMYSKFSGFSINLIGLTVIMLGGFRLRAGELTLMQTMAYLLAGAAVLIYTPFSLKWKAKKIMEEPRYQSEIKYQFDEEGVYEQLIGHTNRYLWSEVKKAISTPKDIVFYLEDSKALVFPKDSLQEDFMGLMKLIVIKMKREQVYIR